MLTLQNCLGDKMSPQKVKIKKQFSNNAKSNFLFFNFNFFGGHFVTKVSLHFWNSRFFIPSMTYFKEKYFHLSEVPFFTFFYTRAKKDRNALKERKKNAFLKQSFMSFADPKLYEAYQFSKILSKSMDPIHYRDGKQK